MIKRFDEYAYGRALLVGVLWWVAVCLGMCLVGAKCLGATLYGTGGQFSIYGQQGAGPVPMDYQGLLVGDPGYTSNELDWFPSEADFVAWGPGGVWSGAGWYGNTTGLLSSDPGIVVDDGWLGSVFGGSMDGQLWAGPTGGSMVRVLDEPVGFGSGGWTYDSAGVYGAYSPAPAGGVGTSSNFVALMAANSVNARESLVPIAVVALVLFCSLMALMKFWRKSFK